MILLGELWFIKIQVKNNENVYEVSLIKKLDFRNIQIHWIFWLFDKNNIENCTFYSIILKNVIIHMKSNVM